MSEQEAPGWQAFLKLCSKMKTEQALHNFFSLFLTFSERDDLTSRCRIIQALLEGQLTQREIAEKYQVSIAQITRGSNALKNLDSQFKKFLRETI